MARTAITRFSGGGPAYFVSASSLGPALAALSAHVKIASPTGTRTVAVEKFFSIPEDGRGTRDRSSSPQEIVTEILIPSAAASMKNATYVRFVKKRRSMVTLWRRLPVALKMNGAGVASARIVMGHVRTHALDLSEAAEKSC